MQNKFNDMTVYEISKELGIPESTVRNLQYKVQLKHPFSEIEMLESFLLLLINENFKIKDEYIFVQVENLLLRGYLNNLILKSHSIVDYSHNSNILVLDSKALFVILKETASKAKDGKIDLKAIEQLEQEILNNDSNKTWFWKKLKEHIKNNHDKLVKNTSNALEIVKLLIEIITLVSKQ